MFVVLIKMSGIFKDYGTRYAKFNNGCVIFVSRYEWSMIDVDQKRTEEYLLCLIFNYYYNIFIAENCQDWFPE